MCSYVCMDGAIKWLMDKKESFSLQRHEMPPIIREECLCRMKWALKPNGWENTINGPRVCAGQRAFNRLTLTSYMCAPQQIKCVTRENYVVSVQISVQCALVLNWHRLT